MADISVKNCELVSSGDTVENRIVLEGAFVPDSNGNVEALIQIVLSATGIQFSNNANIDAGQNPFITDSKFVVTFNPSIGLYFKQSSNSDSFTITI